MTFFENLRTLRNNKRLTQEELAELLDVSRQAVSKWESDNGYPEMDKLIKLSLLFDVSLDNLMQTQIIEDFSNSTDRNLKDNKNRLFSVVLLKESTIFERKIMDNTKVFEESIILLETEEDFFENNSQEDLIKYFSEKIPTLKYENIYGEIIRSSIVLTVDYFEIIDSIRAKDFTEVFNRIFIEKIGTTIENIIDKHYDGFIFKK